MVKIRVDDLDSGGDYISSEVTLIDHGPNHKQEKKIKAWVLETEARTRWSTKVDAIIIRDTLFILKPNGPPKEVYIGLTGNFLEWK